MTASKTNIPLIEMPQSISVITRDQIDLLTFIGSAAWLRSLLSLDQLAGMADCR